MNKQDILTLYQYNQWANRKILEAARNVTQEQFLADASFPHGGLRSTLTHTLFAEWIWRNRWEGTSPVTRFKPEEFPHPGRPPAALAGRGDRLMEFVEGSDRRKAGRYPSNTKIQKAFPKRSFCGMPWRTWSITAPSTAPRRPPCLQSSAARPATWI